MFLSNLKCTMAEMIKNMHVFQPRNQAPLHREEPGTRLRVLVIKAANSLMPSHPGPPSGKCLVAWFKFLEQGMSNKIRMERSGVHKNWQLEWECVTRIEAHGPDKVIKPYQKQNTRSRACLATMHNGLRQCSVCEQGVLLFLVLAVNSALVQSYTLLL